MRPIGKLIIQIPCFNEEATLGVTLDALPRSLPDVGTIEWLIVNDGSTDGTEEVARARGVHHIVTLPFNQGLARAFMAGIEAGLQAGADVLVNLDADNQYRADDIPKLLEPILAGRAHIVVGARPIEQIAHFSLTKKILQRLGSWVVRVVSGTRIADAPSGFRAITREAALRLNVFNSYTYTLEMIVQAGQRGIPITSVPIRTNPDLRPSRLVKNIPDYIRRTAFTLLRIFITYKPMRSFLWAGSVPFIAGLLLMARWVWLFYEGTTRAHVPSLIVGAVLVLIGFHLFALGMVADLMAVNRKLLEDLQLKARRQSLPRNARDSAP